MKIIQIFNKIKLAKYFHLNNKSRLKRLTAKETKMKDRINII